VGDGEKKGQKKKRRVGVCGWWGKKKKSYGTERERGIKWEKEGILRVMKK
jgi:hypothetical protein